MGRLLSSRAGRRLANYFEYAIGCLPDRVKSSRRKVSEFIFVSSAGSLHDYGYNLAIVYLIWIAIALAQYPVCRWFASLKQRNKSVVLSYL